MTTRARTLRLPLDQAEELEAIAGVDARSSCGRRTSVLAAEASDLVLRDLTHEEWAAAIRGARPYERTCSTKHASGRIQPAGHRHVRFGAVYALIGANVLSAILSGRRQTLYEPTQWNSRDRSPSRVVRLKSWPVKTTTEKLARSPENDPVSLPSPYPPAERKTPC